MYGLPNTTDLSFMKDQKMIQACFGANELILRFDGSESVTITIMSSISCSSLALSGTRTESFQAEAPFILDLIDVPIKQVSVLDKGTLELTFESGSCLYVYDDSLQFESYTIEHQGKLLVV